MERFWLVFTGVYSAIFSLQISLFFRQRSESKLRAQHCKEREEDRKNRDEERDRSETFVRSSISPNLASVLSPHYLTAFEQGRLEGRVKGMCNELDRLMQRVALLEAESNGDQRGAA